MCIVLVNLVYMQVFTVRSCNRLQSPSTIIHTSEKRVFIYVYHFWASSTLHTYVVSQKSYMCSCPRWHIFCARHSSQLTSAHVECGLALINSTIKFNIVSLAICIVALCTCNAFSPFFMYIIFSFYRIEVFTYNFIYIIYSNIKMKLNLLCTCFLPEFYQMQAVYLPDWVLGPTVVTVDLSYQDVTQVRCLLMCTAMRCVLSSVPHNA